MGTVLFQFSSPPVEEDRGEGAFFSAVAIKNGDTQTITEIIISTFGCVSPKFRRSK